MIPESEGELDCDDGPSLLDVSAIAQRRKIFASAIRGGRSPGDPEGMVAANESPQTSLAAKYGGALDAAVKRHADDPTIDPFKRRTDGEGRTACLPAKDGSGDPSDYFVQTRSLGKLFFHISNPPVLEQLLTDAGAPTSALSWELRQLLEEFGRDCLDRADCEQQQEFGVSKNHRYTVKPKNMKLGVQTTRLCEVSEQPTAWLWDQRIPLDNLTLISGHPDVGKTWVVLDILARTTTGRGFPDGSPNPFMSVSSGPARRNVLWVTAEDSIASTIKKRFRMLRGDESRFEVIDSVLARVPAGRQNQTEDRIQSLSLSDHLEYLDQYLTDHPLVAAIALDPLAAFLGKVDAHRYNEVRAVLTPVAKLAEKHQVAIIGINHLNKGDGSNAMNRSMGSMAFVAAARSSWLVSRDPKEKDRRLFTEMKGNLRDREVGGLAFRVGSSVPDAFCWEEGVVETTANEALAELQSHGRDTAAPARAEAKEWLRNLLKDGPVPAADVEGRAKSDGLCWATVKAAKKELGVVSVKTGGSGEGWAWKLP